MPEKRNSRIAITIEPTLQNLMIDVINEEGQTISDYGRGLIVSDLTRRGKLTPQIWAEIATDTAFTHKLSAIQDAARQMA